jgi:glutathione S-transferase
MSYILIGSQTSPFVRRIRMLLDGIPHELRELNIYETDDGIKLNKENPVNQIPVLIDGEQKVWDSRQIFNYLNLHHTFFGMNWDDENVLTAIDGAMTSGVALLLMKRSGMNTDEPFMYVNRQKERIESVLDYLKPFIQEDALKEWNFLTISLYSFLDWGIFRGIVNLEKRPECQKFMDHYKNHPMVQKTAIPKV